MENDTTKDATFFRFEGLRIYDKAQEYINWTYNTTMLFPSEHTKDLISKFNNSAQAIAFNIAEGSARNKNQFVYYLKLAKSAVRECIVLTTMAERQAFVTESQVEESRNHLMEMTKMLGGLIGSLQRNKTRNDSIKTNDNQDEDIIPAEEIEINKY